MIRAQRRLHLVVWAFLAPALALLTLALLLARPPAPHAERTPARVAPHGAPQ